MEMTNIADELAKMRDGLDRLQKGFVALRKMNAALNGIAAGALPSRLTADKDALDGLDAPEVSDAEFLARLADIASSGDGVSRMIDCATLVARLVKDRARVLERSAKLASRIRMQREGEERTVAIALKAKQDDAASVIANRVARVLAKFFEARLWTLNAAVKMSGQLLSLFPDGDEALRTAALASSAKDAIATLAMLETRATQGRATITTTGKRRTSI